MRTFNKLQERNLYRFIGLDRLKQQISLLKTQNGLQEQKIVDLEAEIEDLQDQINNLEGGGED